MIHRMLTYFETIEAYVTTFSGTDLSSAFNQNPHQLKSFFANNLSIISIYVKLLSIL